MTIVRGLAAAIAVVVSLGAGCSRDPVRILLIGDSITVGRMSAPPGIPYARLLAAELGPGYELVNVACGGTSSFDWTRTRGARQCRGRFVTPNLYEADVLPVLPVDVALIMLGTNDAIGVNAPTAPEAYGTALQELLDNLRQDGVRRVVLTPPPLVFAKMQAALLTVDYRDMVTEICGSREDVTCGPDVLHLLQSDDFEPGNRHPNGSGHRKLATALLETIRSLE